MDARNDTSARLATRVGMRQEARFRSDFWSKGEWTDTVIFAVLGSERGTHPKGPSGQRTRGGPSGQRASSQSFRAPALHRVQR